MESDYFNLCYTIIPSAMQGKKTTGLIDLKSLELTRTETGKDSAKVRSERDNSVSASMYGQRKVKRREQVSTSPGSMESLSRSFMKNTGVPHQVND